MANWNPSTANTPGPAGAVRRWVTLARACEILGVNESTVRRWADSGQLHVFRTPGGHRRFAEDELYALLESGGHQPDRVLENAAVTRIRRGLHSGRDETKWNDTISASSRDQLRPLGRRLLEIVDDYIWRRARRSDLELEVTQIGEQYGRELRQRGITLTQAMQAFTFFRQALDQAAKQLAERSRMTPEEGQQAREQIAGLADRVLLAFSEVYEPGT
ncbi:MAG: helix-turn-helix domain-containing protein [Dehalococcoidia bacterium]|nr:MAG: helix-turn-helix domain-containing protein [Dehalococcoidia bacterium]